MNKIQETLDILQEECAEIIQEVSKIRRFGIDTPNKNGVVHRNLLANEIGDVLAMIDILLEFKVVTAEELAVANSNKKEKLKKWSSIYE